LITIKKGHYFERGSQPVWRLVETLDRFSSLYLSFIRNNYAIIAYKTKKINTKRNFFQKSIAFCKNFVYNTKTKHDVSAAFPVSVSNAAKLPFFTKKNDKRRRL
jgi:hypothetical protein